MSASTWCTVESDPGVFTELISAMGARDIQVEELYSLEEGVWDSMRPVYGLIFLFKWRDEGTTQSLPSYMDDFAFMTPNVFFANQVVNNACATQAILSVLLNCPDSVDVGDELRKFKDFTKEFPPEAKGLSITNSDVIRNAHNSFARPEQFVFSKKKKHEDDDDDVYHFIAYVPIEGVLYELDGLKPGPIALGPCADRDWLELVRPVIQKRIDRYASNEIHFNLMAVIKSRKVVFAEEIARLQAERARLVEEIGAGQIMQDTPSSASATPQAGQLQQIDTEITSYNLRIAEQDEKMRLWEAENRRRKFNYVPFIVNMLKCLADSGQLEGLLNDALAKEEQERAAKKRRKEQSQSQTQATTSTTTPHLP
ncbi:ubiquitin carboxyl-terminal hydrolase 2 [Pelomyxa schiedti]|nr:ubiquitin carboxyl-terminal hydrolase 2 [Pelomyxa schiedti]